MLVQKQMPMAEEGKYYNDISTSKSGYGLTSNLIPPSLQIRASLYTQGWPPTCTCFSLLDAGIATATTPRLDTSLPCGKWHSQCIINKHSKSSPQLLSSLPKVYRQIFYMGKPTLTLQKKIPTPQIISLQSKCFSWWSLGSTVKVFYIPSDMRSLLRVHFFV